MFYLQGKAAAFEKLGIGKRQMSRVWAALERNPSAYAYINKYVMPFERKAIHDVPTFMKHSPEAAKAKIQEALHPLTGPQRGQLSEHQLEQLSHQALHMPTTLLSQLDIPPLNPREIVARMRATLKPHMEFQQKILPVAQAQGRTDVVKQVEDMTKQMRQEEAQRAVDALRQYRAGEVSPRMIETMQSGRHRP